jgi:hypothetical protein
MEFVMHTIKEQVSAFLEGSDAMSVIQHPHSDKTTTLIRANLGYNFQINTNYTFHSDYVFYLNNDIAQFVFLKIHRDFQKPKMQFRIGTDIGILNDNDIIFHLKNCMDDGEYGIFQVVDLTYPELDQYCESMIATGHTHYLHLEEVLNEIDND